MTKILNWVFKAMAIIGAINKPKEKVYSTEVTEGDLVNAWIDEYGVKYSADRKRLLKAPDNIY